MIAVVGPCGSGKTTLVGALRAQGIPAKQVAQEHSYVPRMWQVLARPHVLVYLDASFAVCTARKSFGWTVDEYKEQLTRLSHAREHCDIYIQTDLLLPEEVTRQVAQALGTCQAK